MDHWWQEYFASLGGEKKVTRSFLHLPFSVVDYSKLIIININK